jgi:hypothetical protein
MPLGATDLTNYRPHRRTLLLDIAYDLLDPESLDIVRAWWRLRRLRKFRAKKAWARFQRGSYTVVPLPAPKYPPPAPTYRVRRLDGSPADGYDVDILRRARVLPDGREVRAEWERAWLRELKNISNFSVPSSTTIRTSIATSGSNEAFTNNGGRTVGLFSGVSLKDVKIGGGKAMDFKGEGDFTLKVVEVKGGETRKREKYFEVIHEVVASTNEEQPVGSKTNLFCMLQGSGQDLGLQNMKEILCTLSGLNPHTNSDANAIAQITDEKWIEIAELACADQKTFGGTLVNCSVNNCAIKAPKAGGRTHYLRRRYTPNDATIAAMAASAAPAKAKK